MAMGGWPICHALTTSLAVASTPSASAVWPAALHSAVNRVTAALFCPSSKKDVTGVSPSNPCLVKD